MADSDRVVSVEICGQRYPIRSTLDAEYVNRLAGYVDEKIRAAGGPEQDPLRQCHQLMARERKANHAPL